MDKPVVRISVRNLVEFILRSGDLDNRGGSSDREAMQKGSRLHRKIQGRMGSHYRAEVSLKYKTEYEDVGIQVEGRADGIFTEDGQCWIDEIKGVYADVSQLEKPVEVHRAQAMCYAWIYAQEQKPEKIGVQMTYGNLDTEELKFFREEYTLEELGLWYQNLLDRYHKWIAYQLAWKKERNASMSDLEFPFEYREGQRKIVSGVYHTISTERQIFVQAPTGVGKTMSTIFPAVRAVGAGLGENIFYLTAKTITRTVAEEAFSILKEHGLKFKVITITAKEKLCFCDKTECNPENCLWARGHLDRVNDAVFELWTTQDSYDRDTLLEYAKKWQVCPFEMCLDLAVWVDAVICDYNYVFDPHVNRKSLIEGSLRQNIYLIDEAHNLLDRARDMYSADIAKSDFKVPKKYFKDRNRFLFKKLNDCIIALRKLEKEFHEEKRFHLHKNADAMYFPIFHLIGPLEEYLTEHDNFQEREEIVEFYFKISHFYMILDNMDSGYEIYSEKRGRDFFLRLFCVDPSEQIEEYIENSRSSIFFSATLLPVQYYRQLLGGNRFEAYQIASPFQKEKRLLAITEDVTSRYTRRGEWEYRKMVGYLELSLEKQTGNYMIFFPSYEMLSAVYEIARDSNLALVSELIVQEPFMEEKSREDFLEKFRRKEGKPQIGFCVLGSIFSEGIDLTGESLIGVVIVGTGLPQICNEREVIREYFDRQQKKGYDYAYRYPGMNKVLQAAGRVIRTAQDTGTILLMDERFLERENQKLFPEEWDSYYGVNRQNYGKVLKDFWEERRRRES